MRTLALLVLGSFFSFIAHAQEWNWGVSAGGPSNRDRVWDIATDSQGNVYWAGSVSGPHDFVCDQPTTTIPQRGILAKYDDAGACQWVRRITSSGDEVTAFGLAIDADDRIYVTGEAMGTIGFGNGITIAASGAGEHWFVARYTAAGDCLWARRGGGDWGSQAHDVAVDEDGTIYVAGTAAGDPLIFPPLSIPSTELLEQFALVAYDSTGTALWAQVSQGGTSQKSIWGLAVADGKVFITGQARGTDVTMDGMLLTPDPLSQGLFVAAFTTAGDALWAHNVGNGDHYGMSVAADTLGNVFVVGEKNGAMTLPDGEVLPATGSVDMIFLGFGADGTYRWGHTAGTAGGDRAGDVEVDHAGNAYVVFDFVDDFDFLGIPLVGPNNDRIGTAKFTAEGEVVWANASGTGSLEAGMAIHQRQAGDRRLYFGGSYWGDAEYGDDVFTDNGNGDALLVGGIDTTFDVSLLGRPSCPGACTGSVIAVCNGRAPFTFAWNNGTTAQELDGLCPGEYIVEVTDSLGQVLIDTVVIGTATDPGLTVQLADDSLWLTGGSAWQWYVDGGPIAGAEDPYWIALRTGAYHASYVDAYGCTWETPAITVVLGVGMAEGPAAQMRIFPNPVSDRLTIAWAGAPVPAELVSATGQCVRRLRLSSGLNTVDVADLPAGLYLLRAPSAMMRVVKH